MLAKLSYCLYAFLEYCTIWELIISWKHSLVKNRIFGGLYNFLHQHGSLIKSMCTSCKSSKNASVEVEESGVKCRVILCQMSNYLSWISAYDNCIWIFRIIRFALEKYFLSILSKLYSTMRRRMAWWNWWKSEATFERRSSLHSLRATQLLLIYIIFVNNFICFNYEK